MHIHHDDSGHEDGCEVCVVINNFHSADLPDIQIDIASIGYGYFSYTRFNVCVPHKIQKGFYSTAPPSF